MLAILRAVAEHPTQAKAYRALGIPYINGAHRLGALIKKTGAGSLDELFQIAVEKGWLDSLPKPKQVGLVFTKDEAKMVRACIGAKSVAAASRMHTIYVKLGVQR